MKKILSGLAAVLITTATFAQHGSAHSAIGIKAGVNGYSLHTDTDDEFNTRIGYHAGLVGHLHLSENFALQPEVVFSSQGARTEVPGTTNDVQIKLNYLNVPVMAQYMFNNGFRIQAGPQFGVLMSARQKFAGNEFDIKDELQSFDFSLGAGVSYVHPKSGVGIDARYNFGLNNISEDDDVQIQNRGAQIGLFYLIHRKKS